MQRLRDMHGVPNDLRLVSRNGMHWRSAAETNVANFLWFRGITPLYPRKYPPSYKGFGGGSWGEYDLAFVATTGHLSGKTIDVEVWGGYYAGGEARVQAYAATKAAKQMFNKDNACFVEMTVKECYSDEAITNKLAPFIGRCEAKTQDTTEPPPESCLSSIQDVALAKCADICTQLGVDVLPGVDWLERRGQFRSRAREPWEPKGLQRDIRIAGGIRKIRSRLGQQDIHSRAPKWSKDTVISEIQVLYKKHGVSPRQLSKQLVKEKRHAPELSTLQRQCHTLVQAARRYFGTVEEANRIAGIDTSQEGRWSKEKILHAFAEIHQAHGAFPSEAAYQLRKNGRSTEAKACSTVHSAAIRHFGSYMLAKQAAVEAGITS